MKKIKYRNFLIVLICWLFSTSLIYGQNNQPTINLIFDEESVKNEFVGLLLNKTFPGYIERYGFFSADEVKSLEFGKPIAFYVLPGSLIIENQRSNKLDLLFIDEWLVPVIADKQIRCFIFLKSTQGKISINRYGFKLIADELIDSGLFDYNTKNQGFLLVGDLGCKFLIMNEKNESLFVPLGFSHQILNHSDKGFIKADLLNNLIITTYSEKYEIN